MSLIGRLIESVMQMPSAFTEIALHDPVSAVLLALGTLLFGVVGLLSAYLVLGAVLQIFTPSPTSPTWRPTR